MVAILLGGIVNTGIEVQRHLVSGVRALSVLDLPLAFREPTFLGMRRSRPHNRFSLIYRCSTALALWMACSAAQAGPALPTGGQVQAGGASIGSPSGSTLTINQSSSRAIINWQGFSIGQGATVEFNNGSGATLNRVTGTSGSDIDGFLSATGSVYLINPNGVIIGKTGVVDVGGTFAASTQNLSNSQFLGGGDLTFAGASNATVINYGKIGALGGDVALIAARTENDGTITAPKGDVGLAAGYQVILRDQLQDDGKFSVVVGGSNTSATNRGVINAAEAELRANGGNVYALAGNTQSIIKATGVSTNDGRVFLVAQGSGTTAASGEIAATQSNGAGGQVETSGASVDVTGLTVKAHSWLVDPYDLTVTSSAATSIDSSLNAGTSVTLETSATGTSGPGTANASGVGNINITAPISWSTSATLTLDAYTGINITAPVTVSGAGNVALNTNQGGSGGSLSFGLTSSGFAGNIAFTGTEGAGQSLTINGAPYTLLYSMSELQNVNASSTTLSGNYALANSLNASAITGWVPIGNAGTAYSGTFEGLGNTISNLTVTGGSNSDVGLFGFASGTLRDIGLVGGSTSGSGYVGSLVGFSDSFIYDDFATGTVTGGSTVGGLVGYAYSIENSYATGAVTGGNETGGLAGSVIDGVNYSYATGAVQGGSEVGGLVGNLSNAAIVIVGNSYATGAVTGTEFAGGLVGVITNATITDSYATGAVTSPEFTGGLVGFANNSGANPNYVGGSYWDTNTTGQSVAVGGGTWTNLGSSGLTTSQLQGTLPSGFSSSTWGTGANLYPYLLWQYPTGAPQSISGTAYQDSGVTPLAFGASGAQTVSLLVSGTNYGSVTTGADGYYYFTVPAGTLSGSGDAVLAYSGGTNSGARLQTLTGATSEFDVWGSTLIAPTSDTIYSAASATTLQSQDASLIAQALGSNSNPISGLSRYGYIATGASFTVDEPLTLANGLFLQTIAGDAPVTVANSLTITGASGLTLDAAGALSIDAPITVSGAGGVVLNTNQGGTGGDYGFDLGPTGFGGSLSFTGTPNSGQSLTINGAPYTLLYSVTQLAGVSGGDYALALSLNASGKTYTNAVANVGGIFTGLGNTISNLTINSSSTSGTGLFGLTNNATIRDIGVVGGSVNGLTDVGALVGDLHNSSVKNAYATGVVTGGSYVGGLVGYTQNGSIADSFATGAVSGNNDIGGLVGGLGPFQSSGDSITNSYAAGSVTAYDYAGGLVGINAGTITASFASGAVTITGEGEIGAGGLVGSNESAGVYNEAGSINNSYATGAIYAWPETVGIGGLAGINGAAISDSYSTGAIIAINANYQLTPPAEVGGLVGGNTGTIAASYWATDTSGMAVGIGSDQNNQSGNVAARTIAQLQGALPSGFSSATWDTGSGLLPYLLWQAPSDTPQAVSGIVTSLSGAPVAGLDATIVVNGANVTVASAASGVNGYYYDLVEPGSISNGGSQVLAYFPGAGGGGLAQNATGSVTGLNVYSGFLSLTTSSTSYASVVPAFLTNVATAIGSNGAAQAAVNDIGLGVITSGSSFTIDTPVNLSQGLFIKTTAANANIAIDDPLTLSGANSLTLDASGTISQNSSGTITAATITGSSSGAVTLDANNAVANLGSFATGNSAFSLTDSTALNIDGAINVGTGTLTLAVAGPISSTSAGIVTAGTFTGSSIGATSLTANNAITNLGSFTTGNGAFALTNAGALTINGTLNSGTGSVTLSIGGALTESGAGLIAANELTGSSSGAATLQGNNAISSLGAFATNNGNLALDDLSSLTVTGAVSTGSGNLVVGVTNNIVDDAVLSGNIIGLVSTGNITVNAPMSFPFQTTGSELAAEGSLNINAPITVTSTGGVILQAGYDTTTVLGKSILELNFGALGNISFGTLDQGSGIEINGTEYQLIYSMAEVQQYIGTAGVLSGNYALANSIDASTTTGWIPIGTNGSGSILNSGAGFSGTFEGLGNTISNLTVSTGSSNYAGLFGYSTGTIRDLTLTGGSVAGSKYVGGLTGYQSGGLIDNVVVTVPVSGSSNAGGIVGDNTGAIVGSYATGAISGATAGGLAGTNSGKIVDDDSSGAISGTSQDGGLIGSNSGTITDVYSTGSVSNASGGLIGAESGGSVTDAYWDTQTSGASTSAAGTGLTTSQLQGALPTGFSNTVWGTGSGLFPYFLRQFPNGAPDIVSGTAYTSLTGAPAAGETLTVFENGSPLGSVTTGTNGNFSALLAPGGDAVIFGAGTTGATVVENVSGPVTGLSVYGNTLNEVTSDSLYSTANLAFESAVGNITLGGTSLSALNTIDHLGTLRVDATSANFTIDEAMSWATVDLVAAGSINGGGIGATTLTGSSNGPVTLSNVFLANFGGFTTNNGALLLEMSGVDSTSTSINVTGAINTGTASLSITTLGYSNVLNIDAPLTGSTVSLNTAGSIVENSAGIITASTLTGSAGGSVPLETAAFTAKNVIANLGAFEAEGGFSLTDATALKVVGTVDARSGNLVLTTVGAGNDLTIATAQPDIDSITLQSARSILIDAPITIPGGGQAVLTTNDGGTGGSLSFDLGSSGFAGNLSFTGGASSGASLSINGAAYTLVYTASQLAGLSDGGDYALANTINASGTTYTGAVVGGTFTGSFDGLGNTISNLTISAPSANYVGLFGIVGSGGAVTDLGLTGASVTGGEYVGALVGMNSGTLTGDDVSGAVTGGTYVGGLVGANYGTVNGGSWASDTVSGASVVGGLAGYNTGTLNMVSAGSGTVSSSSYAGGLVGFNDTNGTIVSAATSGATVSSSGNFVGGLVGWSVGSISGSSAADVVSASGSDFVGGLVGREQGSIANSSASGSVTGTEWVGGLVGYTDYGATIAASTASGAVTGGTYVGGLIGANSGTLNGASSASGTVSATGSNPVALGGLVGFNQGSIATTAIESTTVAAGTSGEYVGGFVGFNNTGGTIMGAEATGNVTGGGYVGGLVGANYGAVTNASSAGGTPSGSYVVGGLAGYNVGTITGSQSSEAVSLAGTSNYAGGLVGYNGENGTISASDASGAVTGGHFVGGLVGANYGTLNGASSASGAVNGAVSVGGIAGYNTGVIDTTSIENATATGSQYVGGIAGYNDTTGTISAVEATGNVTGSIYVGGLLGANYGIVNDGSSASGAVTGTNVVGGLVGYNTGALNTVSAGTGTVTGNADVGGLAGYNDTNGTIASGTTSGAMVTASAGGSGAYNVGGLVGFSYGAITGSSSADGVSTNGASFVGGLVGQSGGAITNSSSSSTVSAGSGSNWVGGLAGWSAGPISDAQATGSVTGGTYVGGLVGANYGMLTASSSTGGNVNGALVTGGLVGFNTGAITLSFSTEAVSASGGDRDLGGLVGYNDTAGTIANTYATGAVGAGTDTGGLVGYNLGSVATSYSDGAVASGVTSGGVAGDNSASGVLTDVYWDEGTSGRSNALGAGTLGSSTNVIAIGGSTGNDIYSQSTYIGFDFTNVWEINPATSRPYLRNVTPQSPPS
jgi:filamentous hemagglutinin family protein